MLKYNIKIKKNSYSLLTNNLNSFSSHIYKTYTTLKEETFAGRNFREFREFWPFS